VKTDLHIHSRLCSDGKLSLPEIFREAHVRDIGIISITDHDNIACQMVAETLADEYGMQFISGVELNIVFSHPRFRDGKRISLDILGYQFDMQDITLTQKVEELIAYRRRRAEAIFDNINLEFKKRGRAPFTQADMTAIEATVDGAFGRPHIANYMVKKGIVATRQEAFDNYLVACDVPKMPLSLEEASSLIRGAGGKVVLAHGNDPNGTSLAALTSSIEEQCWIIKDAMLPLLDGIECWHSRLSLETTAAYTALAHEKGLMMTGGSDCHQDPIIMGTVDVPSHVASQFDIPEMEDHHP